MSDIPNERLAPGEEDRPQWFDDSGRGEFVFVPPDNGDELKDAADDLSHGVRPTDPIWTVDIGYVVKVRARNAADAADLAEQRAMRGNVVAKHVNVLRVPEQ